MQSSNPVLTKAEWAQPPQTQYAPGQYPGQPGAPGYDPYSAQYGQPPVQQAPVDVMTIDDVITKSAITLGTVILTAALTFVGFTSGGPTRIMSNHVLIKGLTIMGVRAGESARRQASKTGSSYAGDYAVELPRLAELGVMRPHISHRFPMERAADAFRVLIDRKVVGKAVIDVTG